MIFLELMYVFAKLGLFSFGGGTAMITLIQSELLKRNWTTPEELANIVAISQVTPGTLGLNASTFIGYTVCEKIYGVYGGILGSFLATFSTITDRKSTRLNSSH